MSYLNNPIVSDGTETPAPSGGMFDDLIQQDKAPAPQPVVPQPQPSETFVGQATDTISGLADQATTGATNLLQRAQSLAPSVLGSDPAAQAANEEILRRQQRQ